MRFVCRSILYIHLLLDQKLSGRCGQLAFHDIARPAAAQPEREDQGQSGMDK